MREHEITDVDVCLPVGERIDADSGAREHELELDAVLAKHREAQLAGVADEDHSSGDANEHRRSRCRGEVRIRRPDLSQ